VNSSQGGGSKDTWVIAQDPIVLQTSADFGGLEEQLQFQSIDPSAGPELRRTPSSNNNSSRDPSGEPLC